MENLISKYIHVLSYVCTLHHHIMIMHIILYLKHTEAYSCHIRKILCLYNDIYVVITTSDGCRYNEILSRYNDILSRYNDLQWMSL